MRRLLLVASAALVVDCLMLLACSSSEVPAPHASGTFDQTDGAFDAVDSVAPVYCNISKGPLAADDGKFSTYECDAGWYCGAQLEHWLCCDPSANYGEEPCVKPP